MYSQNIATLRGYAANYTTVYSENHFVHTKTVTLYWPSFGIFIAIDS